MIKKLTLRGQQIPHKLQNIPSKPKELFLLQDSSASVETLLEQRSIAIVGSRKLTPYGRSVTEKLAYELAELGIVIVSGLAIGVDSVAHRACLEAGGQTIAVLPSGLDEIYPRSHQQLADKILGQGGALITEYPGGSEPYPSNFIARNRLVAGLADALLVTEAALKSGTLHTVNFALGQGKPVFAVPGNITSQQSEGTNNLIKTGAQPVTELNDILSALGLEKLASKKEIVGSNKEEQIIIDLLKQGASDASEILASSKLPPDKFNQTLTMLEINGVIKPLGNNHWALT